MIFLSYVTVLETENDYAIFCLTQDIC